MTELYMDSGGSDPNSVVRTMGLEGRDPIISSFGPNGVNWQVLPLKGNVNIDQLSLSNV